MIKTELTVIDYYHEHKGWELVAEAQKEADIISKQMENDAFFMSPGAKTL